MSIKRTGVPESLLPASFPFFKKKRQDDGTKMGFVSKVVQIFSSVFTTLGIAFHIGTEK